MSCKNNKPTTSITIVECWIHFWSSAFFLGVLLIAFWMPKKERASWRIRRDRGHVYPSIHWLLFIASNWTLNIKYRRFGPAPARARKAASLPSSNLNLNARIQCIIRLLLTEYESRMFRQNKWINKWINEQINVRMNQWMNEKWRNGEMCILIEGMKLPIDSCDHPESPLLHLEFDF